MAEIPLGNGELTPEEKYEIGVCYGTIIGTGALAIIVGGARLFTRKFLVNSFMLDDWATVVALISVTIFNGIGVAVTANGAGKHINNVPQEDLERWFLLYYVCICIYLLISFFVKAHLLIFQLRLFPVRYVRIVAYSLLILMVLFTISGTFVAAFQCNPPKYVYDIRFLMAPDRADHCFAPSVSYAVFMYQAVFLFATDIIILLLPTPAILGLKLSKGKGFLLFMIFGSGIVACIAPALRFQSLNFYKTGSTDTTFVAASSLYWMAIEYNLGVVAGSLACLRPLFIRMGLSHESYASRGSGNKPSAAGCLDNNSYQLRNMENGSHSASGQWRTKLSRMNISNRVQGESILDRTVRDHQRLDDTDEDSHSRKHIIQHETTSDSNKAYRATQER